MVDPSDSGRTRRAAAALATTAAAAAALAWLPGCGMVPKSRMEECHRVSQTLRAENGRLKDVALELRTQNQDLSQRAVDDARRIAARDEANERLVTSVQAYQAERDKLAAAFQAIEGRVRTSADPLSSADASPGTSPSRLKAFALAHPGWAFDEESMALWAPPALLFAKGADALTPDAVATLKALAAELPGAGLVVREVVGPASSPVVAAQFEPADDNVAAASGRFLGAARGARVRERLSADTGLDPSRVRLSTRPAGSGPDGGGRVEIRFAGATDAPPASRRP